MTGHPLLSADPQTAGAGLLETLGLGAGAEALFRAFLAEHDHDRFAARFWLQVYHNIVAAECGEGSTKSARPSATCGAMVEEAGPDPLAPKNGVAMDKA
jgi:hypothetical protein